MKWFNGSREEMVEKFIYSATAIFQILFLGVFLMQTKGGIISYPLWKNVGTKDVPLYKYETHQYQAMWLLIVAVLLVLILEASIVFYGVKKKTYLGVVGCSAGMLLYFGMFVQAFYNGGSNLLKHIIYAGVGIVVMWFTYFFIRVKMNEKRAELLKRLLVSLIILNMGIIAFGIAKEAITGNTGSVNGSYAWLKIGPITIQIGEFLKMCIILLSGYAFRYRRNKRLTVTFLGLCAMSVIVLAAAKDLGNAVVLLVVCVVSAFFMFEQWWWTIAVCLLSGAAVFWAGNHIGYVKRRFDACFHALDAGGGQHYESLIAIVKNGLKGTSPSGDVVSVTRVTSSSTDFVFNVILGIFGAAVAFLIIAFLLVLIYQMIMTPIVSPFHYMIAVLSVTVFFSQYLIHIGGNLNILPLTGICCNFISSGGSNMIVSFMMLASILACLSPELESTTHVKVLPEGWSNKAKHLLIKGYEMGW